MLHRVKQINSIVTVTVINTMMYECKPEALKSVKTFQILSALRYSCHLFGFRSETLAFLDEFPALRQTEKTLADHSYSLLNLFLQGSNHVEMTVAISGVLLS